MLAIVIPYYKKAFFKDCLQSLANQTDKRFRVYIGDDESTEDPLDVIEGVQDQIEIFYLRFEKNLGNRALVKQWERCIALTKEEEWIAILGDDDILDSNCVANFYKNFNLLKEKNINVFRFANQVINLEGKKTSNVYHYPRIETSKEFLFNKLYGNTRSSLSEYIFNRNRLMEVKFKSLPLAWHSDELAIIEVSDFGDILSCNESIVYFRNSGFNISSMSDNLVAKNQANFKFFYYLIYNYNRNFEENELKFLWERLEKAFLDDKKQFEFWMKYAQLIFKYQEFKRLLPFKRKILNYNLKVK